MYQATSKTCNHPAPHPTSHITALEDQITELAAHIHAATFRLLELIREVVGKQISIVVSPMGLVDQRLTDSDLAIWSAAVARLNDPRVYVLNDPQGPL